jgi:hypothetical protein
MSLERHAAAHSKARNTPLIGPHCSNLDENVNPEVRVRVNGAMTKITPASIASDPTFDDIHVVTGADTGAKLSCVFHLCEGSTSSDQLLFDFGGFLEGGALDDVFGISRGSKSTQTSDHDHVPEGGKWDVTKLSGGLINVTVRAVRRRGDHKSWRSAIIKYAPPFVAAVGEDAPCGTFRQVSTFLCFCRESHALSRFPTVTILSAFQRRLSNTEPCPCSAPHLASRRPKLRTRCRSRGSSSSSRIRRCW